MGVKYKKKSPIMLTNAILINHTPSLNILETSFLRTTIKANNKCIKARAINQINTNFSLTHVAESTNYLSHYNREIKN
jgi:hypothetical protein